MKTRILLFNVVALVLSISFTTSAQVAIPSDGLVANYPFNGTANDVSGNGNNGLVFGATLTFDRFGNPDSAYHFGSNGDYVFIATSPGLNITGDLTIAAWVYLSNSGIDPNAVIFSNMLEVSPHNGYSFRLWDGNKLRFFSGDQSLFATTPLESEQWIHVAVVLSGTTATTYINGTFDSSGTVAVPTSSSVNPTIGASRERVYGWNGALDDILVYNRALSAAEISELAQVPEPSAISILASASSAVLWISLRRNRPA